MDAVMRFDAQRMRKMGAFFFSTLNEKIQRLAAEGRDVIRLDVGSPDLPPTRAIVETLCASAKLPNQHGYQAHNGPLAYRQAWAGMYHRTFGVDLDPDTEVLPLLGSKEGIFHLSQALINPGDIALVPDPGYPTYSRGALFAGGSVQAMPLKAETDFLPDLGAIPAVIAQHARILWLNYPNNPTAASAPIAFFEQAVDFAREHGLVLCHDAAYTQVAFEGYKPPSILQVRGAKEVAVEFNTLSKSHNMAGWRVGVVVGNPQTIRSLYTLKTNLDSGHFRPIIEAATQAMNGDQSWLAERNEVYRRRRDVVIQSLSEMGFAARTPCASMYVWSAVPQGWSSLEFTTALLEGANVSLSPGTVFGPQGEGYFRISFVAPQERIKEAMHRMAEWWQQAANEGMRVASELC